MKYGQWLERQQQPEFEGRYIDYEGLKAKIEESRLEYSSGTVPADAADDRYMPITMARQVPFAEVSFYALYESQVAKVSATIEQHVVAIHAEMKKLNEQAERREKLSDATRSELLRQAEDLGTRFLNVEKYVNTNYLGLHKILKKHDKNIPNAACRQFYLTQLHREPWLAGGYGDVLTKLSAIFSQLRGDTSGVKNEDAAQGFVRTTTKYWVRAGDISTVKYRVLQHLPVFQFDASHSAGDAQLINSVYLDNSSAELYHGRLDKRPDAIALRLRWYGTGPPQTVFVERKTHREGWKGETSVKERFTLAEARVLPFLHGTFTVDEAVAELEAKGKPAEEIENFRRLFSEIQKVVDSKQLRPMVRTQYMRTAFQIPFDATVRVSLDTNLAMIRECKEGDNQGVALGQRWYRDPELELKRWDVTRFPHAVLEVKLSLPEGTAAPAWVQALLESGMTSEVHKFSKFIHGVCTLFPKLCQAVPYWVDDASVRPSMIASTEHAPAALNAAASLKARTRGGPRDAPSWHPALAGGSPLELLNPDRLESEGVNAPQGGRNGEGSDAAAARLRAAADGSAAALVAEAPRPNFFDQLIGANVPRLRARPQRLEPKTFLASERTFLSWLHMAVTIGSIASGLLGFAAAAERAPSERAEVASVEVICMILLPLAIALCLYALGLFLWRNQVIKIGLSSPIDDRRGPLALAACVVLALSAIFLLSIKDLADTMAEQGQDAAFLLRAVSPLARARARAAALR